MAYVINISARAERDLAALFNVTHAEHSDAAWRGYRGLNQAILRLEEHPNRCPETPENPNFRHLLYGRKPHVYRVIYRIREKRKQVDVPHIRHGARQRFHRSVAG